MSSPAERASGAVIPALAEVYAAHFAYVWRTLLRLGVVDRDAEDLAQEVFVIVHRRLHTFDPARPVRPWLFGIAYNVWRDHHKRASSRHEQLAALPLEPDASDPGFRAIEAAQLVRMALQHLPEERRVVFIQHELDRVPIREVAQILQIPVNTAYSRLRVGRGEFRDAVQRLRGGS